MDVNTHGFVVESVFSHCGYLPCMHTDEQFKTLYAPRVLKNEGVHPLTHTYPAVADFIPIKSGPIRTNRDPYPRHLIQPSRAESELVRRMVAFFRDRDQGSEIPVPYQTGVWTPAAGGATEKARVLHELKYSERIRLQAYPLRIYSHTPFDPAIQNYSPPQIFLHFPWITLIIARGP